MTLGAIHVSPDEIVKILANKTSGKDIFAVSWEQKTENIIWNIRFPRVIMAFIVGAGLSLCGVLMQALTKNPLADPYVLGISSGASAGAVSVIILGLFSFMGGYSVIFGAFSEYCVCKREDYLYPAGTGRNCHFRLVLRTDESDRLRV